jgi:hypothetical protein
MEAGEWSLHEEDEEGRESMLGGGDGSETFVLGWEVEMEARDGDGSRRDRPLDGRRVVVLA